MLAYTAGSFFAGTRSPLRLKTAKFCGHCDSQFFHWRDAISGRQAQMRVELRV